MRPPRRTPEELLAARRAKLKAKIREMASKPAPNLPREIVTRETAKGTHLWAPVHEAKAPAKKKGNKKK